MVPGDHAARRRLEIRPLETSPVFSTLSWQLEEQRRNETGGFCDGLA
jgi:hypothetical protein